MAQTKPIKKAFRSQFTLYGAAHNVCMEHPKLISSFALNHTWKFACFSAHAVLLLQLELCSLPVSATSNVYFLATCNINYINKVNVGLLRGAADNWNFKGTLSFFHSTLYLLDLRVHEVHIPGRIPQRTSSS